ncbi:MAG: hypothetical protein KAS71_17360 [Bacteroidales bacterium]|nr:hypothetical protein [Bacteroidales bacterium]
MNKITNNILSGLLIIAFFGVTAVSCVQKSNVNWNLYSSFTLEMPEELMIGLAVTSHNSEESTIAVFSSFQLID